MTSEKVFDISVSSIKAEFYVRKQLMEDRVLQFMMAYEYEPDTVPPILIAKRKDDPDTYIPVDGRHRLEAAKNNKMKTIKCKLVEGDMPTLIGVAFKANLGGAAPPTSDDIRHTIELLFAAGIKETGIYALLPMPKPITRQYIKAVRVNLHRKKLQAAALAVVNNNTTVTGSAERHGVDPSELRDFMSKKTKREIKRGADQYKGPITHRYRSLSQKNGAMMKKLMQQFEDGEASDKIVLSVLAHLFAASKRERNAIEGWANRFTESRDKIKSLRVQSDAIN